MERSTIAIWGLLLALMVLSSTAFARKTDRELLNKALDSSNLERAEVESTHRKDGKAKRSEGRPHVRSIQVEIGDEMSAENDGFGQVVPGRLQADYSYREKGTAKRLEREWKEVNRPFNNKSKNRKNSRGLTPGDDNSI